MRAYFERKYTHALAIVRRSGACEKIETLLRDHSQGGAPRALSVEHLLAATITAMDPKLGVATQVSIHNLLTTVFSPAFHHRHRIPTGLTIRQVRYLFQIITTALDFSPHGKNNQGASKEELKDIEDRTFKLLNAFLRASIPTGLPEPEFMAIDATAIETWARRKVSGAFDKDAEYGYRTATYANGSSKFFGHRAIASATCFNKDSPFNKLHLINGQILTSNVGYEPPATLELLDNHILPHAATTPTLLVDRGFSDSVEQNWAHRLRRRNINQFFDLKITDIKEVDPVTKKPLPDTPKTTIDDNTGVIMFAGWPYVPWTPKELFNVTRPTRFVVRDEPGKGASARSRKEYADTKQAIEKFEQQIEALAPYALVPNGRPSPNGSWRFFTIYAPAPPANWNYPEKDTKGRLPKVYRQETITVPAAAFGKHQQGYRWGTKEWIKIYARRTAVEGVFGNLKQSVGENTKRDNFRVVGRTAISLLHTLAMVHYNLRRITKWAQENSLSVEVVYAATSEEALLALLQTETDPAEANAPPIAA